MQLFSWEKTFDDKSINSQVKLFDETLMNIFNNFTPK